MRRNKLKGLLGILFMVLTVAAMYFWLTYGTEVLATKAVLVAREDILEGTVIDPERHFIVDNRSLDSLISGSLSKNDIYLLKGMAAKQYIPKNAQIDAKFFCKAGLVITEDKVIFKIPNSWIYAVPTSIRRGDDIQLLEIDSAIEKNIKAMISNTQEGLPTFPNNAAVKMASAKPILASTVIYVKDSANREVVDVDHRQRMDGSSQVSSIEIVCTKEEIKTMEQSVSKGMQFIIVYN